MSPRIQDRLAQLVLNFSFDTLPPEVVHETKRLVLDTLGCAVGAFRSVPGQIARQVARSLGGSANSSVIGCNWKTTAPLATLVNGTLIRFLDSNDYFFGADSGHASSNIPPALALGQYLERPGTEVINAIVIGYELHMRLCDAVAPPGISARGWHTATYVQFSTAALSARLLGRDPSVIANALAIAGSHCNTLAEAQRGAIPLMKATAEAYIAKGAVESALLAAAGLTGPSEMFEGAAGWEKVVAGAIDYDLLTAPFTGEYRLMRTCTKPYSAVASAMAPIQAAIELHREGVRAEHVETITVRLPRVPAKKATDDPKKLAPEDKETADHSIHYCVAVALLDGDCGHDQFTQARIRSPEVASLIRKIRIEEDVELTRAYPGASGSIVSVKLRDGRELQKAHRLPPGHFRNRVSDTDIERKFVDLSQGTLTGESIRRAIDTVWSLDRQESLDSLFALLVADNRSKV